MDLPRDDRGAMADEDRTIRFPLSLNLRPPHRRRRAQSPDVTTIGATRQLRICSLCYKIGLEPNFISLRRCSSFRAYRLWAPTVDIARPLPGAILNEKKSARN